MRTPRRVGVLISGRGSNLGALIAACADQDFPARIVLVVSDNPSAAGLGCARDAGVAIAVVERRDHPDKAAFDAALDAALRAAGVEIVCLAGFMRLLSPGFVERWRDRMINIHPSLLPDLPGLDTHARALRSGARRHGATVHFVRIVMDTGPIIVQSAAPILPGDTPEALADRVLAVEHRIYPLALGLLAGGKIRIIGEMAVVAPESRPAGPGLIWPDDPDAPAP